MLKFQGLWIRNLQTFRTFQTFRDRNLHFSEISDRNLRYSRKFRTSVTKIYNFPKRWKWKNKISRLNFAFFSKIQNFRDRNLRQICSRNFRDKNLQFSKTPVFSRPKFAIFSKFEDFHHRNLQIWQVLENFEIWESCKPGRNIIRTCSVFFFGFQVGKIFLRPDHDLKFSVVFYCAKRGFLFWLLLHENVWKMISKQCYLFRAGDFENVDYCRHFAKLFANTKKKGSCAKMYSKIVKHYWSFWKCETLSGKCLKIYAHTKKTKNVE